MPSYSLLSIAYCLLPAASCKRLGLAGETLVVPCALAPSGPPHRSLAGLYPAAANSRQLSTPLGVVPRSLPWQDFRPVGRLPPKKQA